MFRVLDVETAPENGDGDGATRKTGSRVVNDDDDDYDEGVRVRGRSNKPMTGGRSWNQEEKNEKKKNERDIERAKK